MLGLSEDELWQMSPRSFYNKLKGYKMLRERDEFRHSELVFTILSPHMKKADRERAYRELEPQTKPRPQKVNPVEFWNKIDNK